MINGNKVFTSGANQADYVWLACRTDPDAPKHKGISIIIVPTASPGFKMHADRDRRRDIDHQATYYDDVRVPKGNVVGDVNGGWRLITTQLNHERVGLAALGGLDATGSATRSLRGAADDRRRAHGGPHDRRAVGAGGPRATRTPGSRR